MRAIQMTEFGGPEVLRAVELPVPQPGPGEVLIKVELAGLNFADTHTRTNSYVRKATLPLAFGVGRLIATASSPEKRALAMELGADAAVDVAPEGLSERLLEANSGRALDVVFEMSGGEVFDASYRALAPFGRLVVCGIA